MESTRLTAHAANGHILLNGQDKQAGIAAQKAAFAKWCKAWQAQGHTLEGVTAYIHTRSGDCMATPYRKQGTSRWQCNQ